MSSMRRMYSSSSSATHHIFFPPRLQVVAFQQNPNRLPSHARHQFAFHHFFGQQAHRPARAAFRWWTTGQRHDALPMLRIQQGRFPRSWSLVQGSLQVRLADSVGWSAIRSSGLKRRSSPLGGWVDRRPVVAAPKLAARSAPAVNHSATSATTPVAPAWTTEPKIAPSCPSYKLEHVFQQVFICITLYTVIVLVELSLPKLPRDEDLYPFSS